MHYNTARANPKEQTELRRQLRNHATAAEAVLWRELKGRGLRGLKFRRQQGIGPYVLDFYCPELRLCIELDGSSHDYKYEYDVQRTAYLREQGIRVVRYSNEQVRTSLNALLVDIARITEEIEKEKDTDPTPNPSPTGAGNGCASSPSGAGNGCVSSPTVAGNGCASSPSGAGNGCASSPTVAGNGSASSLTKVGNGCA